jgi:enediyne biosynthesis protein E3
MEETSLAARLRLRILGVDDEEVSMERRGFVPVDERAREQLETIARTFLVGYRLAIVLTDHEELARRLEETELEFRGFAHEGAAMGLTVLDGLMPLRRRLRTFLSGPGYPYAWMAPIGFGWARAQMHRRPRRPQPLVDPLLDWFALDGAGFHDGFFHPERFIEEQRKPALRETAARVYDQGIGRSLWFVQGADVEQIAATIGSFPVGRQADLWSGLSSAATYAGGVEREALERLVELGRDYRLEVAQGAAFAIKARLAGGNPTPHTDAAAEVFCQLPTVESARLADVALEGLRVAGHPSPYDAWRQRVQDLLAAKCLLGAGAAR